MRQVPFHPAQFTPTQWSSEEDKAEFSNNLLRFIESGFRQTLFTHKLYKRLSSTFGQIAYYNREGFWEEWFAKDADKPRFLQELLCWPCHGDPKFTFSDVERAVQAEVRARNLLARFQAAADRALEAHERTLLESLEAKYRSRETAEPARTPSLSVSATRGSQPQAATSAPPQGTLF
jgi:hypothetical protein